MQARPIVHQDDPGNAIHVDADNGSRFVLKAMTLYLSMHAICRCHARQPHCPKQQPPRIQRKLTSRLLHPSLRVAEDDAHRHHKD
jgi:hypothetical protein